MQHPDEHLSVLVGIAEPRLAAPFVQAIEACGHAVRLVRSAKHAADVLAREHYDVVVLEATFGEQRAGLDLARDILRERLHPEVVVLAQTPQVAHAVAIAKAGAFDYVSMPATAEHLASVVTEAGKLSRSRRGAFRDGVVDDVAAVFLESSVPAVQELEARVRALADKPSAQAMIVGESGTGKDLVARLIHARSEQARGPFVVVDLWEVPEGQMRQRLFGTAARGADETGMDGAFAVARGGTLVLKHLADAPMDIQEAILQVLQARSFVPLHGDKPVAFHARILCLGGPDLFDGDEEQRLHPVLSHLLGAARLYVPALRERASDVASLSRVILAQVADDAGRPGVQLSASALDALSSYQWPGNVRELRNVLTTLVLLSAEPVISQQSVAVTLATSVLRASQAVPSRRTTGKRARTSSMPAPRISGIITAALDASARAERERIEEALARCEGHRGRAADELGMARTTLWTRMRLLGIDTAGYRKLHTKSA